MCEDMSVERRLALSMAVARLVSAREQHQRATAKLDEAIDKFREVMEEGERFVVKIDFKTYLVEMPEKDRWDITEIKTI